MYCSQCGARCPEGARFCHLCGAKLHLVSEEITPPASSQPVLVEPMPLLPEEAPQEIPSPELPAATPSDQAFAEEPAVQPPAQAQPEDGSAAVTPQAFQAANAAGKRSVPVALVVLLAIVLLGVLCYALLPDPVYFAQSVVDSQANWLTVTADGALSFQPEQYSGSQLTVPDSVAGLPVTALSSGCFADATDLVWIQLPTTLEAIGSKAFSNCSALRGMFVPKGVASIDAYAFENCTALEAISIPGTVTSISESAFDNCPKLRYIFFDGPHSQWAKLYDQSISPYTFVFCTDGTYLQGAQS